MKHLIWMVVFLLPGTVAAQIDCGSTSQPCSIAATVTAGSGITLNTPAQSYVNVPVNGTIQWTVTGAGVGLNFFLIVADYKSSGSIFGSANNVFFKGDANNPVTERVKNSSNGSPVHYFIYALDSSGNPWVLDPKVITGSTLPTKKPKKTK